MSPTVAGRKGLRSGWTTGTCASAAAKAAFSVLRGGVRPDRVEVGLPAGRRVRFPIEWDGEGRAVVVKDAGDDPDCTDGARMTAEVRWADSGEERVLRAGEGVGTITKLGLGLALGAPAINPVPRRMILAALGEGCRRNCHVRRPPFGSDSRCSPAEGERQAAGPASKGRSLMPEVRGAVRGSPPSWLAVARAAVTRGSSPLLPYQLPQEQPCTSSR